MVPYVRRAVDDELGDDGEPLPAEKRLIVFPGLELTLSVPCQALLILDASFPDEQLNAVLSRLALPIVDPSADRLPPVTAIDIPLLSTLYEELDKEPWLRGHYIVFPNVTDGGHQTLLRAHMHHKYREMPCVGGYLDGTIETKVGLGNRQILDGLNPEYGNKRIALVQTSDARDASYADLGKHTSWIKWSVATAEALRQACLAQESRISHSRPEVPTVWISRLSVDNCMFLGPIELELNQQFNAIIGGRGTGKSTILEYLRWALCDLPASVHADDELGDPGQRQRRLISTTLLPTDSTVEVHFTINEIQHVVRRAARSGEVTMKVGDGEFQRARESEVQDLLPIQAYSQKQLSSVSVRMDELTRFVTSPIRRQLLAIDQRIDTVAGQLRENYATLQRRRNLLSSLHRLTLTSRSLAEQATNLRASLENVSEEDRAVLDAKAAYDGVQAQANARAAVVARATESLRRWSEAATEWTGAVEDVADVPVELREPLGEFRRVASGVIQSLSDALAGELARLEIGVGTGSEYEERRVAVQLLVDAFNDLYTKVKERSTAHTAKLTELAEVERQHQAASESLRNQQGELQALGQPEAAHSRLMRELFQMMSERSDVLASQCARVSDLNRRVRTSRSSQALR
jgi:type III restriction enzyme